MSKIDKLFEGALQEASNAKAPKLVHDIPADGRYIGTCQACFGQYVVKLAKRSESTAGGGGGTRSVKAGTLVVVLHGYERPGYGYVVGECPGRGEEPFEIAKNITEHFRDILKTRIKETDNYLDALKHDRVEELWIEIEDRASPQWAWHNKVYKKIKITRGWISPESRSFDQDTFQSRIKTQIYKVEGHLKGLQQDLKYLEMRLSGWKYDPQALLDSQSKKIGIRADEQAGKEAVQSSRVAARDIKEKKVLTMLGALLASKELMDYIKTKRGGPRSYSRPGEPVESQSSYDRIMAKLEKVKSETNQVERIDRLKYVVSELKDFASSANYPTGIKIKYPRP